MIQINDLNFSYSKERLFAETSLQLQPGNIYGLLGTNGAGKSSLLRLLSGLLFPSSGKVDVMGYEPRLRQPSFLSKLFLLPETVVVPNVTEKRFISAKAPFYPKFDAEHMERCLQEFDVPRNQNLRSLSHGQQKKFLLSFGLACRAEVLLLDEPTNGLDIPSKGLFRRLVAESLNEEQVFVVSTHQVHDLESLIDAIVVLYSGKILLNETIEKIANCLRVSISQHPPESNDALIYCERTVGGYASLWREKTVGGQVDLELLFKSVIQSPESFEMIFASDRDDTYVRAA